ncbi:uncharacterized protein GIQ15_03829 [Arthroderma uncinatum]|uniref:uncharacterized protein n=1 Tax=Arthroderma uncinatum TaxID=74035 RepID=UPI00144A8BE3|nr:uncharacterized protein GIQ15_03829 [Arthroderma uncinatum]KAF3481070.1 hypothetical protein GIQ15_03829 [Arthroderma uncinatum]
MEPQNSDRREPRRRPTYTIRRIKPSDFSEVAAILAKSMKDDDLYTAVFPRREEHYDISLDGFLRLTKERYWTPGCVMYVAVTAPDGDNCSHIEKIVGHASWKRTGTSPAAQIWTSENEGGWNGLQLSLCRTQDSLARYFQPNKTIVEKPPPSPQFDDNFPSSIFPELWYLATLAVDPEYRGQGIDKLLAQRGIHHAVEENVPLGLESSARGRKLYDKMGFKLFKTTVIGEMAVPVMVWEPPRPSVETEKAREWQGMNGTTQIYTRYP